MADLLSLIRRAPKTELHLHLDGCFEPELMLALAARNNITLKYNSVDQIIEKCNNISRLKDLLDLIDDAVPCLLHEQDFYDLAMSYFVHAHADGVVHCEMFFSPQGYKKNGVSYGTCVTGLARACQDARQRFGLSCFLIPAIFREDPAADAAEILEEILDERYLNLIAGLGMDAREPGNPPAKFVEVFARAKAAGLRLTSHAGEEGDPHFIPETLDELHVDRIDHGIKCVYDDEIRERLRREQVPMTVCPISNIKLRFFNEMKDHPIKNFLERGMCVSVNSDDPGFFRAYLMDTFKAVHEALHLTPDQACTLLCNSFTSSWLPEEQKAEWITKVREMFRAFNDQNEFFNIAKTDIAPQLDSLNANSSAEPHFKDAMVVEQAGGFNMVQGTMEERQLSNSPKQAEQPCELPSKNVPAPNQARRQPTRQRGPRNNNAGAAKNAKPRWQLADKSKPKASTDVATA